MHKSGEARRDDSNTAAVRSNPEKMRNFNKYNKSWKMRWNAESRYVGLYNTYDTFLSFTLCFELNLLGERITVQGSDRNNGNDKRLLLIGNSTYNSTVCIISLSEHSRTILDAWPTIMFTIHWELRFLSNDNLVITGLPSLLLRITTRGDVVNTSFYARTGTRARTRQPS